MIIGRSSGACDILSPMSDINTGRRRIVSFGNAGHCNSKKIKGLAAGKYYWRVQAIDNCFEGSMFSDEHTFKIGTAVSASIKVFLQGPYNSGSMSTKLNSGGYLKANAANQPYKTTPWNYTGTESVGTNESFFNNHSSIVDWVLVQLRTGTSASTATTVVAQRAAFLKNDGTIVDMDGTSPVDFFGVSNGSYYIVVEHRNHLSVISASAVTLPTTSICDFTASGTAYGTNAEAILSGGKYGMYAGDCNSSGIVTASDITPIASNLNGVGYSNNDVNLSGIITASDITPIAVNLNTYSQVPK